MILKIVCHGNLYLVQIFERTKYVLDFIQNHPLAEGKISFVFSETSQFDATRTYGIGENSNSALIRIPQGDLYQSIDAQNLPCFANSYTYNGHDLYDVAYQKKNAAPFINAGTLSFDIIQTIFFHISRIEEVVCPVDKKDIHGRMYSHEQFLVKNGLHHIPVVDHLVFCFLEVLGVQPSSPKTVFRLTSDIDMVRKYLAVPPFRSTYKYVFEKPSRKSLFKLWRSYIKTKMRKQKDPYNNFEWLFSCGKEVEKVVYFLVGGRSKYDKPFAKINKSFVEIVNIAIKKGWEIGIHPSYTTVNDGKLLKKEKELLEEICGIEINQSRQHFLRFSIPETAALMDEMGMKEDSSLGYPDRIGFRCATGFPYHLYNFEEEAPYQFIEVPLVVMDVGLLREGDNNNEKVLRIWEDFLAINSHRTQITFNFHNSIFFDTELDGINMYKFYK